MLSLTQLPSLPWPRVSFISFLYVTDKCELLDLRTSLKNKNVSVTVVSVALLLRLRSQLYLPQLKIGFQSDGHWIT